MDDKKPNWRRYQKLRFDPSAVAKRAKKAETATVRHGRKFIARRLNNARDVRRHIFQWLIGIGVLIIAVGVQMVWFQNSYTSTVGSEGGTYAEATVGSVRSLNPLYASTSTEISASQLIFSSLFDYDTTGHLLGDLAKDITLSKDSKTYTVTLRDNIRWHDGRRLSAEDVVFTLNLIRDPAVRSPLRTQWVYIPAKAIDDTTVEFDLPSIYAAFPHALTFPILPKHLLENVAPGELRESTFSVSPVGSGPFEYKLLQTDDNQKIINMTAFADYYKGEPKIGRFEIHGYQSTDQVLAALQSGQVNASPDVTDVSKLQSLGGYTLKNYSINDGVFAFLNTSQPALKEKAVRRALQRGLNIDQIRDELTGNVTPLNLPFVSGQLEGVSLPKVASYDPAVARKLLTKAGWKQSGEFRKKKGKLLTLNVVTIDNAQYKVITEQMKKDWAALGVDVQVSEVDLADALQDFRRNTLQPRAYDVLVYEISIGADPDVYAFWHSSQVGSSGLNLSVYKNKIVDDALSSARSRSEQDLRNLKYQSFLKQWVSDVPAIGMYQSQLHYVQNKSLESLNINQRLISPYDRYANVQYWTAARDSVYNTP